MMHVLRLEHSTAVWKAIDSMFASVSQSRITNLCVGIADTKKLNMTTPAFLAKMQRIADELAAAGRPVPEDEQVPFILASLGADCNILVSTIGVRTTPIPLSELYSQIDAHDERQLMLQGAPATNFESSANYTSRQTQQQPRSRGFSSGHGTPRRDDRRQNDRREDWSYVQGRGGGRGNLGGGRGRGHGRRLTTPWVDVTCQICKKEGHPAKDCWWHFDEDYESYADKEVNSALIVWIQTGTRILELLTTSQVNSIT
jgi:hypothetical protein